ncbi:MAG TPA: M20/M25/M40 family metallo-hydrolase [Pyrinomonadaceae bacterium]|nr:M20/M25/M40 family metallo-hydrolase [Pyrinomonadaceae bacterium]
MTLGRSRAVRLAALLLSLFLTPPGGTAAQTPRTDAASARIVGEVFAGGKQLEYVSALADRIGSRLTGTPGARRAEEWAESEMKRLGLSNVRREPYRMAASWERGAAGAWLVSDAGNRTLAVASYTWTPGTEGPVEGEVVDVGAGRPEDVQRVASKMKGRVALVVPEGADLGSVIYNFYRAPGLVRELKEAGALAVLLAADKPHAMLYTAPVEFSGTGRLAALPTLSLAHEDVGLLRRLLSQNQTPRVRLDVRNKIGPAFDATNVVGEIAGTDLAQELVVVGAHLDSNDLGPGALDNAAGSAAVLETARAIKALGLRPRRTIRFVLFTGEEEGMVGSIAYVERHRAEMDRTVAALVMDVGAGRPVGWFSMGREDLDADIRALSAPLAQFGDFAVEHAAFAATDNAPFMAEGVPNLVLLQDETPYFPVHHTIADTPDKIDPRDYASAVAALAVTAYQIADRPQRFGRRLGAEEVRRMADETKVGEQWRAAGIWK